MEGSSCKRKAGNVPSPSSSSKRFEFDDAGSPPCSNVSSADRSNLNRSLQPFRFMFYERGEWKDFSQETSVALVAAFQVGHRSVKFTARGNEYLLSFVKKLQLNLNTGFCRSVGWIDANGNRFMPSRCLENYVPRLLRSDSKTWSSFRGASLHVPDDFTDRQALCRHESNFQSLGMASRHVTCSRSSLHADKGEEMIAHSTTQPLAQSSNEPSDSEVSSDSSEASSTVTSADSASDVTSSPHSTAIHRNAAQRPFPLLDDSKLTSVKAYDSEFEEVKKRFMAGLSVLASHVMISGIKKNCHRTTSGQVHYEAFRRQEELTKRLRGDANVRCAWYATSKQGVSRIVLHGFGQPKTPRDGAMYGVGVYLAPERYSKICALCSDVDESGEQHAVLCRVIMGNMEQVARGSVQFHPGSEDYDNGVDNLCNPKQYIVWSTYMNTHILPEYIVSFKLAASWQGVIAALRGRQKPKVNPKVDCRKVLPSRSSWMSIDRFLLLLKASLSEESMSVLEQHYRDLKGGTLSSFDFIISVRKIAGDGLVSSTLKSMRAHALGAVVLQNMLTFGQD